jgi:serine/threonine protein kinase
LEGLAFMHHQLGWFHGDIKGCNIMVDNYGEVKLIDFGFSGPVTQQDRSSDGSRTCGTKGVSM